MLFNSPEFIFIFLPITLIGFYLLSARDHRETAILWLVGASLVFYGWWNPSYLMLLGTSVVVNYTLGLQIAAREDRPAQKPILIAGLIFNLGLLGYFKYADFLISSSNFLLDTDFNLTHILLPLAISFFTFQQIAYLIDVYQKKAQEYSFLHYCLFVTFFPQLIAGPIVHHKEMMPQFANKQIFQFEYGKIATGMTIFMIGLFKKVVLADGLSSFIGNTFTSANLGIELSFIEAWFGALAFTCQVYYDFSGYSDMAIGLAWMFGIKLPINFSSPYKASSIIQLWNTWHMTLARFLRDYLYIPLGGNRKGPARRYVNLMTVMLLGGLWHGAGWTFVAWGGLQGIYIMINHWWRALTGGGEATGRFEIFIYRTLTLLAFAVANSIFRSESYTSVSTMFAGMAGLHGFALPDWCANLPLVSAMLEAAGATYITMPDVSVFVVIQILGLIILARVAPNTQQIVRNFIPRESERMEIPTNWTRRIVWTPTAWSAFLVAVISATAILSLWKTSEFLYYHF